MGKKKEIAIYKIYKKKKTTLKTMQKNINTYICIYKKHNKFFKIFGKNILKNQTKKDKNMQEKKNRDMEIKHLGKKRKKKKKKDQYIYHKRKNLIKNILKTQNKE